MAALQTAPSSNIFFSKYLHSLSQTPHRLRKRMLATWTSDQELNQVRLRSGVDMKRKLGWYVLSNASVARSFTYYLCCAFGQNHDSWRVEVHGFMKGFSICWIFLLLLLFFFSLFVFVTGMISFYHNTNIISIIFFKLSLWCFYCFYFMTVLKSHCCH